MKIAILGTGNLGYSIAVGILTQDNFKFKNLYLTKRDTSSLDSWNKLPKVKISTDNKKAVRFSDVIIIAVQPNQLQGVLEEIKDLVNRKDIQLFQLLQEEKLMRLNLCWVPISLL